MRTVSVSDCVGRPLSIHENLGAQMIPPADPRGRSPRILVPLVEEAVVVVVVVVEAAGEERVSP